MTSNRWMARWLGLALVVMSLFAAVSLWRGLATSRLTLRLSAGDPRGHRHELAEQLVAASVGTSLELKLEPTAGGSGAVLESLVLRRLDVALVQGGLSYPESLQQVAALSLEPVHLLVRPELLAEGLSGLRGKTLNLSTATSGTRQLALRILAAAGLPAGTYQDREWNYDVLLQLDDAELPDAVFVVNAMPSPIVERLIRRRGYRLMELPIAESLALRDAALHDAIVPYAAYEVIPPVPATPIHTVGTRLLLVARRDVPAHAITRLMELIYDGDFARKAAIANLQPADSSANRELPLHEGAKTYLNRNQPVINGELIEQLESLRSFLFSGLVALFLLWRWSRRRQAAGFDAHLQTATTIEAELFALLETRTPSRGELLSWNRRLTQLKQAVLADVSAGRLHDDERLDTFLLHVADIRRTMDSWSRDRPTDDATAVAAPA